MSQETEVRADSFIGFVKTCKPVVRLHFDNKETGTNVYRPWSAWSASVGWTNFYRTPAEALRAIFDGSATKPGPVSIVLADGTNLFTVEVTQ